MHCCVGSDFFFNATGRKSPFTASEVRKDGIHRPLASTTGITQKGQVQLDVVFLVLASCSPTGIIIKKQSESSGFSLYLLIIVHIYRGGGGTVIPPSLLLFWVERLRSGTTELHWCDWR